MNTWVEPHFDKWAFDGRRARAIAVDFGPHGTVRSSTGIAFGDFTQMHVQRHERVQDRRLPTPKWAVRDEYLRELVVTYLEERFYVRQMEAEPLLERLRVARNAAELYAPRKRELLDDWLEDYHTLATHGQLNLPDDEVIDTFTSLKHIGGQLPINAEIARAYLTRKKLRDLEIQIQNIDTDLVLTDRGHAEMIVAIVYLYYRLGWDSVTVAEQLQLKPPHVRQVLARLHSTWTKSLSQKFSGVAGDGKDARSNPQGLDSSTGEAPAPVPFDELFAEGL